MKSVIWWGRYIRHWGLIKLPSGWLRKGWNDVWSIASTLNWIEMFNKIHNTITSTNKLCRKEGTKCCQPYCFAVTIQYINCSQLSNWCVLTVHNKTAYGKVGLQLHSLFISALAGVSNHFQVPSPLLHTMSSSYRLKNRPCGFQSWENPFAFLGIKPRFLRFVAHRIVIIVKCVDSLQFCLKSLKNTGRAILRKSRT